MHNPNADQSPFNALPPVVLVLAGVMAAMELMFQAGESGFVGGPTAVGWRLAAIEDYGFLDPIWDWMLENGQFPGEFLLRFLTYPFLHGSFTHAAFGIVFVLALGKVVGEVFGSVALLAVFFISSIFGAVVYGTILDTNIALFGAMPGAYGLIGAFTYLLWIRSTLLGESSIRAFSLIGILMGLQLVFGLLFGGSNDWIADLSGFVAGFSLSFILSLGGWSRLVKKTRQR